MYWNRQKRSYRGQYLSTSSTDAVTTMACSWPHIFFWVLSFQGLMIQVTYHGFASADQSRADSLDGKEATTIDNNANHEDKSQRIKLFQRDPVEVGHTTQMELEPGHIYEMKTVALNPPVFVIPNFLSDEECDAIMALSLESGLVESKTGRKQVKKTVDADDIMAKIFTETDKNGDGVIDLTEMEPFMVKYFDVELNFDELCFLLTETLVDLDANRVLDLEEFSLIPGAENTIRKLIRGLKLRPMPTEILKKLRKGRDRKSSQVRLEHDLYDPEGKLRNRVTALTGLHRDVVYSSELLHVVQYNRSGHYHAHKDSETIDPETVCNHSDYLYPNSSDGKRPKTRQCRFITVLYYLNEPKRGGETAFPVADNETLTREGVLYQYRVKHRDVFDLTNHCHDSNLVVKPQKGTAILWYNHYVDKENEWIGDINPFSLHGGCEVIDGEKWIANNWINVDNNYDKQMEYISDRIRHGQPPEEVAPHRRTTNDTKIQSTDDTGRSTCKLPQDWSNTASMTSHDEL